MATISSTIKTLILVAILAVLMSLVILAPIAPPAEAQTGDRGMQLKPTVGKWPISAKRWAIVIGIDEYRNRQISKLEGAANDARELAKALVEYAGFPQEQVILLTSDQPDERKPERGVILQYLSNMHGLVPKDGLLLVAFAGHGIERGGRAFLLPVDARTSNNIALLEETALSVEKVKEMIRATEVEQVVLILDACRNDPVSGRADAPNLLTESFRRGFNFDLRNREVSAFVTLYATAVGSRAYEYTEKKQGYFTWALVEALRGKAANEDGEVTLGALIKYLQETVPKNVQRDLGADKHQRPFAVMEGYKADELVISVAARSSGAATGKTVDPSALELSFWESIKDSKNADDYKAYLESYPNGKFAPLARLRAQQFAAATSATPSKTGSDPESKPPAINPTNTRPGTGPGTVPLYSYEFDVVRVDSSGRVNDRRKGQARYFSEDLGNGVTLEMVEIPGGTFSMGTAAAEVDQVTKEYERYLSDSRKSLVATWVKWQTPQHQVTVPSFYMGKFEITQVQWRAVARLPKVNRDLVTDPSNFKGDNLPVESVSWEDAMEFCARLTRTTGRTYRLPTEAEWEYACRAGTTTPFHFGDTITPELVNYNGNYPYGAAPKGTYREKTTRVGSMGAANAFGLYDMHGNVWEWCVDVWHDSYHGAPADGSAWESGGDSSHRVLRGGSWLINSYYCRSADRFWDAPGDRSSIFGFRVLVR